MKTLDQCTVRRYVKYTLWFYVLIWWLLILKQILVNIDQELIEKYELDLIDHLYGDKVESLWISITTPVHPEQDVHILQTKNFTSEKPDIVLIHGYGATSALAWRNTINGLSKTYDVLAIDLPGFGRSPGSDLLLSSSIDEAFNHYCHFFEEIFSNRDINSPYVVAHSIGAFIFVRCASRNPDLVSRLLLANVPGLFSSNGAYDYMWATFFTMGLPHNALRICGPLEFSRYIMDTVLSVLNIDIHDLILQYWHLVQLNVHMQSDAIVRKFIRHRGVYALGVGVGLPLLLNLTKPVSLLYGELDPIAPLHQGEYIQSISGIKAYVIDDVSHVPYNSNGGDDFLHVNLI